MGCSTIAARVECGALSSRPVTMPLTAPGIKEAWFTFTPLPVLFGEAASPDHELPSPLGCSSHSVCADFTTSILLTQLNAARSTDFSPHRTPCLPRVICF